MLKLRYNPLAAQDLHQIKTYIANELCNTNAANRILKEILNACQKLKGMPLMGKKLSAVIDVATDFRYFIAGSYLVFYKADSEYISVYRVLHGRQDYAHILFGELPDITEV